MILDSRLALKGYMAAHGVKMLDVGYDLNWMARQIADLPGPAERDDLRVVEIEPGDTDMAAVYDVVVGKSIGQSYRAADSDGTGTSHGPIRFFLGLLSMGNNESLIPATTLAVIDHGDRHGLVELEDVTTVPELRNRGLARATVLHVLHSQYQHCEVACLAPTNKAISFYKLIGFIAINER